MESHTVQYGICKSVVGKKERNLVVRHRKEEEERGGKEREIASAFSVLFI